MIHSSYQLLFIIFLFSCSDVRITKPKYNQKGEMIIHSVSCNENERHLILKDDYGMMIKSQKFLFWEWNRYFLYKKLQKQVVSTSKIEVFTNELEKLPLKSTLGFYNTCTGGTFHRIKKENHDAINNAIDKRKLNYLHFLSGPDYLIFCTCMLCGP